MKILETYKFYDDVDIQKNYKFPMPQNDPVMDGYDCVIDGWIM